MTIEEAIQTLNSLKMPIKTKEDHHNRLAVILGIKALEEIQRCRINGYRFVAVRLSGES